MTAIRSSRTRLRRSAAAAAVLFAMASPLAAAGPASAEGTLVPISGAGSTWSQIAIDQWKGNVAQFGLRVNYSGTGSTEGREQFRNGSVDYGVSEIPYGLTDGGQLDAPPQRKYAYMPVVAGGTSFMYNLKVGGRRVTNLRLSGDVLAKIFTSVITEWNDPAIAADNPGLALPARKIIPVVRSDGSGTTAQLTTWLAAEHGALWNAYCARKGIPTPCGLTSFFPVVAGTGMTALAQSSGVAQYVAQDQNEGTITYVEYAYALNANFPVAKVLNRSGFYIEPTEFSVAVALLEARINGDENSPAYLTQELSGVYGAGDPRAYPLSSYSYMIVPSAVEKGFTEDKGFTLAKFAYYFLCEGQRQAPALGYSPLPKNLVEAGLEQVAKIPGADVQNINLAGCNNPTFSPDGTNRLATTAPPPKDCDKQGPAQCTTGTGGADGVETPYSAPTTGDDGAGQDADAPAAVVETTAVPGPPGQSDEAPAPGQPQSAAQLAPGKTPPKAGSPRKAATPVQPGAPGATATAGAPSSSAAPPTPGPAGTLNSDAAAGSRETAPNGQPRPTGPTGQANTTGSDPAAPKPAGGVVNSEPVEPSVNADTGELELPDGAAAGPQAVAKAPEGVAQSGPVLNATSGRAITAVPVSMTTSTSSGFRLAMMLLAALLLIAVVTLPPLVASTLNDRKTI